MTNDYSPIDSYAPSLAKLRAASATPESTFAERYAAERRREFEAEYAAAALRTAQQPRPRLTAAEQAQYAPPDPYQPALDAMRKEQR